jgi:hypothetical protein
MKQLFSKSDRALELFEKGLDTAAIAERLGSNPNSIPDMIHKARLKRERQIERAGRLADKMGPNV